MAEPLVARHDGRSAVLKWHRARRNADDAAFTTRRIVQGLRAGASVEIDINPLADGDFAVLHDAVLDRETTGTGPVAALTGPRFSMLARRDEAGLPMEERAATLTDLARAVAQAPVPGALLQLDLKCGDADLTPAHVQGLGRALGPLVSCAILSGGDAAAVQRLARATPGLAIGYDPCHAETMAELSRTGRFADFVRGALQAVPEAAMIYLDLRLPLLAAGQGFDLIAPFHAAGKRVDCYTLPRTSDPIAEIAARLIALGADQITTDDPEGLAARYP